MEIKVEDFCIEQIANSGQCFRMEQDKFGIWHIKALGKHLKISKINNDTYEFDTSKKDFENVWFEYFDMSRDYKAIKKAILNSGDPYLIAASNYGYGIRVLKQDPWEATVSFIISQRNNITRIKNIINNLCKSNNNDFPSPEILSCYSEKELQNYGLGYRADYISKIAKAVIKKELSFEELRLMNYEESVKYLKKFKGIGEKVANCIALFGLHKVEAFPIDTWIQYIINNQYHGQFDVGRFAGHAGIIQQYMFFYQRYLGKYSKVRK